MLMTTEDLKNLHIVESLNKGDFKITKHVWLKVMDDDPTSVQARTSHNILQPWISHYIAKTVKGRRNLCRPPIIVSEFPRLYNGPQPIKPAKKKDLMTMMPYIPEEFRQFYNQITTA